MKPVDRVLEVGVGTGLGLPLYPTQCDVFAIDFCPSMLTAADQRRRRHDLAHVELLLMDAGRMAFPDHAFDAVFAPYTLSAVADPVRVLREMRRVCHPDGRVVLLNHFRSDNPVAAALERAMTPLSLRAGFVLDLDLTSLLARARLRAMSVEKVNRPAHWSLVTCTPSG